MKATGLMSSILQLAFAQLLCGATLATAQTPPSPSDIESYGGLHRAAHGDDVATIRTLVEEGGSPLEHAKARGYDEMVAILEAVN